MAWEPLTSHWEVYKGQLENALARGLFDDPVAAQDILYPSDLYLGEDEKNDLRTFVGERLTEIHEKYKEEGEEFNANLIGTYIFRSIILGMMWENERIGFR